MAERENGQACRADAAQRDAVRFQHRADGVAQEHAAITEILNPRQFAQEEALSTATVGEDRRFAFRRQDEDAVNVAGGQPEEIGVLIHVAGDDHGAEAAFMHAGADKANALFIFIERHQRVIPEGQTTLDGRFHGQHRSLP